MFDYDFFVIGAGSGGVRASRMAATYGAKVGLCEDYRVGGTCVIRGCVPKKLFVYASEYSAHFSDSKGFGWSGDEQKFDWPALIAAKDKEIDRLNGLYIQNLKNSDVEIIQARGKMLDAHTVELSSADGVRTVTADKILIATGGWPQMPDIPGIEHAISSNEAFHLETLPQKMAIVGGGYIAVEFAGIFNGMGVETHLLYRGEQILRGFDKEIATKLNEEMSKKSVDVRVQTNVTEIIKTDSGLNLKLTDGSILTVDAVMFATGRVPNVKGLGLEDLGVEMKQNGAIIIDEDFKTSVENIFAVGDVTDRVQLTPVAIKEGAALTATQFNDTPTRVDYDNIPTAVFSQPSIGTVGLSEEQAAKKFGDDIKVYRSEYRSMKFTLSGRPERSLMKLITQKSTDKVIGVHMIGPDSAEIIQGIAIAMKCGATKAQFDATVAVHPSSAEEFVLMK
ncbi:glutathione-disulfide reductase [Paremcibacter congregatus]|uniref:Glutathione reductase n=1 Tax=Paremcibacter congregatus TaxID=2043170 RepID=A0A2G4YUQ4_9PROT|nr:glutathione-disulfide reductase [Paremcibacter congregatus]PHZ86074.1 glutathione-disulfide reductase [Paremcibacter congregatus]QDE27040.1 glutathione-disulfide reductase [Paremcibacter congregatus]